MGSSTLYRGPVDPANWFGIRKGFPNLGYIQVGGGCGQEWGGMLCTLSTEPSSTRQT